MIILGIDPGFERLGVAIIKKENGKDILLFSECFKTPASLAFEKRLLMLGEEIKKIIKKWKPETMAIETLFLNTNQKTAMRVAEVRGVLLYLAISNNLEIIEVSPPQIKMAVCGYGRASKTEIDKMVRLLTKIDKEKKQDDEIDAVAVALTGSALIKGKKLSTI